MSCFRVRSKNIWYPTAPPKESSDWLRIGAPKRPKPADAQRIPVRPRGPPTSGPRAADLNWPIPAYAVMYQRLTLPCGVHENCS